MQPEAWEFMDEDLPTEGRSGGASIWAQREAARTWGKCLICGTMVLANTSRALQRHLEAHRVALAPEVDGLPVAVYMTPGGRGGSAGAHRCYSTTGAIR